MFLDRVPPQCTVLSGSGFVTRSNSHNNNYYFFDPGTQFTEKENYAMQRKIRKQTGMVFIPPRPSQNYQEVE